MRHDAIMQMQRSAAHSLIFISPPESQLQKLERHKEDAKDKNICIQLYISICVSICYVVAFSEEACCCGFFARRVCLLVSLDVCVEARVPRLLAEKVVRCLFMEMHNCVVYGMKMMCFMKNAGYNA